jgi:hypothetical protein
MNWVNGYELGFESGSRLIGLGSCLTGLIGLHEMGVQLLGWLDRSAARWVICGPRASGGELGRWLSARLTGGYKNPFLISNLFNIYSLNPIRIRIQTLNDYSSQNKIQEHFITQEKYKVA